MSLRKFYRFLILLLLPLLMEASPSPYLRIQKRPNRAHPVGVGTGSLTFYEHRYCQGRSYSLNIGNEGDCFNLPNDICDWNLSLRTQPGTCIQVFQKENCQEPRIARNRFGLLSSKVFRNVRQCSSTKLNGFDTVKSIRRLNC